MTNESKQEPDNVPVEVRINGFANGASIVIDRGLDLVRNISAQAFSATGQSLSDPIKWTANAAPARSLTVTPTSPVTFHVDVKAQNVQSAFNGTLTASVISNPNINKIYIFTVSVRNKDGSIEEPSEL